MARTVVLLAAAVSLHCASVRSLVRPEARNAEELYRHAMEDMQGGLYPEAIKGFAGLKAKYPYTKYVALADLRTADTHLHRAKFAEAIDAYRNFLKFHPNHPEGPYAMLQIGEAYYQQIPEDWFFMPPAAEKDQGYTRLAIAAYNDMLGRFPKADHAERARSRRKECRTKLADHELYVAHFYLDREHYRAAAGRAEGLLKKFPNLGFDEEALWIAGWSRFQLGENEAATQHLATLREKFPRSGWASEAAGLLSQLKHSKG